MRGGGVTTNFGYRRRRRRRRRNNTRVIFRRTLGREKIGRNFTTLQTQELRAFSMHAGGSDFVGRNLFLLQWRRAHSYIAPAIAGAPPGGYDFWRSQLPPNGPNFCCFSVAELGQEGSLASMLNVMQACSMTLKMGGSTRVSEFLQPLHNSMASIPRLSFCCGLITTLNFPQREALLNQWLTNVNNGLTFSIVIPPNSMPGSLLTIQQPDGQAVQIQVPVGAPPGSTIIVPAVPPPSNNVGTVENTNNHLPHNCIVHVLHLEYDTKFLIFETPPVVCPGAGQAIRFNPLWSGRPPNLSPAEQTFIASNYGRTRGLLQQGMTGSDSNFVAEMMAVGQALDNLPPATMWMTAGGNNGNVNVNVNSNVEMVGVATAATENAPFQVIVPPNAGQGDSIVVQSPSGCIFSVELPPGAMPGTALMVSMPNAWDGEPTTQLVSAIDMDGDGIADVVGLDTTGDGQHDTYRKCVLVDTNGDGMLDSMAFDSTGDGMHDTVVQRSSVLHQSSNGQKIDAPVVLAVESNSPMVPMVMNS